MTRTDSGSGLSDPIVTYDEQIGRFIIGDQDVDFTTHVSAFDLAVSKTNNPTTLSTADWTFYKITTTESGYDADYPGNFGYNHDALVFTLNMFGVGGRRAPRAGRLRERDGPDERRPLAPGLPRTISTTSASGPRPCTIRSPATRCGW